MSDACRRPTARRRRDRRVCLWQHKAPAQIYYYATDAKLRMPVFRIGAIICARKSTLLEWIRQQEGVR
jgi:hypothetical protein